MEDKRKTEYISKMLNRRTKGMGFENFVISQIYARIDNSELEVVTQKCIKIDQSSFLSVSYPFLSITSTKAAETTPWSKSSSVPPAV